MCTSDFSCRFERLPPLPTLTPSAPPSIHQPSFHPANLFLSIFPFNMPLSLLSLYDSASLPSVYIMGTFSAILR